MLLIPFNCTVSLRTCNLVHRRICALHNLWLCKSELRGLGRLSEWQVWDLRDQGSCGCRRCPRDQRHAWQVCDLVQMVVLRVHLFTGITLLQLGSQIDQWEPRQFHSWLPYARFDLRSECCFHLWPHLEVQLNRQIRCRWYRACWNWPVDLGAVNQVTRKPLPGQLSQDDHFHLRLRLQLSGLHHYQFDRRWRGN